MLFLAHELYISLQVTYLSSFVSQYWWESLKHTMQLLVQVTHFHYILWVHLWTAELDGWPESHQVFFALSWKEWCLSVSRCGGSQSKARIIHLQALPCDVNDWNTQTMLRNYLQFLVTVTVVLRWLVNLFTCTKFFHSYMYATMCTYHLLFLYIMLNICEYYPVLLWLVFAMFCVVQ